MNTPWSKGNGQSKATLKSCGHDGFNKWQPANHRAVRKQVGEGGFKNGGVRVQRGQELPALVYFWLNWEGQLVLPAN